jgi:hypothetical protein
MRYGPKAAKRHGSVRGATDWLGGVPGLRPPAPISPRRTGFMPVYSRARIEALREFRQLAKILDDKSTLPFQDFSL